MNGSPLSQYLAFAKTARDTYRPDLLVVNIVSNDFSESFSAFHTIKRFHCFTEDTHENLYPRLQEAYRPFWFREMVSYSALVRYAYFHLRITDVPRKIRRIIRSLPGIARLSHSATSATKKCGGRLALSKHAADAFLGLLPEYAGLRARQHRPDS